MRTRALGTLMVLGLGLGLMIPVKCEAELLEVGEKSPSFFIRDLDGKKWQLHVYIYRSKGKKAVQPIFVLDFFATWCKPCKGMLPHMQKLAAKYKDRDVAFLLIDHTEKKEVFANWVKANKVSIAAAYDANGRLMAKRFMVESLPTLYIIGRDKRIALAIQGGGEDKAARVKKATMVQAVIKELLALDDEEEEEEEEEVKRKK